MFNRLGWSLMTVAFGLANLPGCSNQDAKSEVGFILRRAVEQSSFAGLRESVVDRTVVVNATCEILNSDKVAVQSQNVAVEANPEKGYQDVRLKEIPSGTGYFARFLGLNAENKVHQCGVTGPFTLIAGRKLWVTIFIDFPVSGDEGCNDFCVLASDCADGWYCSSPCTDLNLPAEQLTCATDTYCCTNATCRLRIGEACSAGDQCGGQPFVCDTAKTAGYCTKGCTTDVDCPKGSFCYGPAGNKGCVRGCAVPSDCRTDYKCQDFPDVQRKGCAPAA